VRSRHFRFS